MNNITDQIKSRINLSSIVSRFVNFDNQKSTPYKGVYWAKCPFHSEKSPSFCVNDNDKFYHCFGCKAHGDHFEFIMNMENISFKQALENLAEEAGVTITHNQNTKKNIELKKKEQRYFDMTAYAAKYYQDNLASEVGTHALEYLKQRGISKETAKNFNLGYCPLKCNLVERLQAYEFSNHEILEAGLAREKNNKLFPFFYNRLMFPINNWKSNFVGFAGRALSESDTVKYLNSPDTPFFNKRKTLYNYYQAGLSKKDNAQTIVCEGYMDVISLNQAGFKGCVAAMGTAITPEQLNMLWKLSDTPNFCLDADQAGEKAMLRAAMVALPILKPGKTLKFVELPYNQDPDDIINQFGAGKIKALINESISIAEFIWRNEQKNIDMNIPETKAKAEQNIKKIIFSINDPIVRKYYQDEFQEKIKNLRASTVQQKNNAKTNNYLFNTTKFRTSKNIMQPPQLHLQKFPDAISGDESIILGGIIEYPSWFLEMDETILELEFSKKSQGIIECLVKMFDTARYRQENVTSSKLKLFLQKEDINIDFTKMCERFKILSASNNKEGQKKFWQLTLAEYKIKHFNLNQMMEAKKLVMTNPDQPDTWQKWKITRNKANKTPDNNNSN